MTLSWEQGYHWWYHRARKSDIDNERLGVSVIGEVSMDHTYIDR